jgi:hypothetical protein
MPAKPLELWRPDPPQTAPPDAGFVPQMLVERISYDDAPWPVEADGAAALLCSASWRPNYGNDPVNWRAALPTAGRANTTAPTGTATLSGDGSVHIKAFVGVGVSVEDDIGSVFLEQWDRQRAQQGVAIVAGVVPEGGERRMVKGHQPVAGVGPFRFLHFLFQPLDLGATPGYWC